jgi:hypothetical protein
MCCDCKGGKASDVCGWVGNVWGEGAACVCVCVRVVLVMVEQSVVRVCVYSAGCWFYVYQLKHTHNSHLHTQELTCIKGALNLVLMPAAANTLAHKGTQNAYLNHLLNNLCKLLNLHTAQDRLALCL